MNDTLIMILIIYLVIINVAGFISMALDKHFAIKGKWRIPEKTLFLFAILGGSIGSNAGMQICRHKTKHWYFVVFMPLILIIQIVLVIMLFS
ncbi:MAG: DUF1294 domain-containing protein [Lachnospiraceae bacterium]|nr:DUF1294 domain-containing protein [Lachnospiraceae bacterium]